MLPTPPKNESGQAESCELIVTGIAGVVYWGQFRPDFGNNAPKLSSQRPTMARHPKLLGLAMIQAGYSPLPPFIALYCQVLQFRGWYCKILNNYLK